MMNNSGSSTKAVQEEPTTDACPNSILSLLDDKNKAIAALQKQLQNQKEQLSYYLKKELRTPRILRLSESCSPRAPQESMTVNMAMNKFGKPLGIKTNICALYERMCIIDDRISACLQDQEFILRKVVNKLCEFVKYANGKIEFKVQFSNFITDPFHIELFDKLLNATMHLRKKLDTFRICCNRLMIIEDERNSIVEHIYSMPVDQRMNTNYIISLQMEKAQLENELKQILADQGEDRERIRELNVIEEKLSNLQRQLTSAFMRTDETCRINKMLQKVNLEAKILLDLTKEQRKRYEKEVVKARSQRNLSLERILLYVRLATKSKKMDEKELMEHGVGSKEDISVFQCIKKEIENGKDKIIGKIFDDLQTKKRDCEALTDKLNMATLEKNELKIANMQLQRDISEIKLNQCKDLSRIKQERDAFKSQVEDLEAIREAYAQLVDKQPSTTRVEREYLEQIGDMDRQINELEKLNMNLTQKVSVMKAVLNKQHREIKLQNEIIDDLRDQVEKNFGSKSQKSKNVYKKSSTDESGVFNSSPRDTILTDDLPDEVPFGQVYEEEIFVEHEINWIEEQQYYSPFRAKQVSFSAKCDSSSGISPYKKKTKQVMENIKNHIMGKANEAANVRWRTKKEKNAANVIETPRGNLRGSEIKETTSNANTELVEGHFGNRAVSHSSQDVNHTKKSQSFLSACDAGRRDGCGAKQDVDGARRDAAMALLMRRLFVDAQAKLRRMVEEHSANLTSRIDPDYPSSLPVPVPGPACLTQELKLAQEPSASTTTTTTAATTTAPAAGILAHADVSFATRTEGPTAAPDACDLDVKCVSDKKDNRLVDLKSIRPGSIEAKRSKSLCNAGSSVDSGEDGSGKKDVKKTRSNPVKGDSITVDSDRTASDSREFSSMTVEESASPLKDSRSSPDNRSESPKPGCSSQPDLDSSSPRSPRSSDGIRDDLSALIPSPSNYPKSASAIRRLRLDNERLQAEVTRLRRLVVSGATSVLSEKKTPTENGDPNSKTHALEMELQLAKEALTTLKADKRRLKAEKFDLLNQMKQLYSTLEDKEKELRDFIRSYGQRVRDNETSLQQLSTEREERERERWSLLRHARDEAERSLSLAAQLNAKELQLQQAQEQLQEARRQLANSGCLSDQESLASLPRHSINGGALTPGSGGLLSGHHGLGLLPGDRGSCSADSGVRVSSDRESGATSVAGNLSDSTTDGTPTITVEGNCREVDSVSVVSSVPPPHMYQSVSTKDCSPTLSPLNANNFSRPVDASLSRSVEQLSSPLEPEPVVVGRRTKQPSRPSSGRGGTWGSISRVFARSRHRNKTSSLQETSEHSYEPYRSWSPLTEEGYAEKLRLLREAGSVPMERWRAPTVLAWLEVALGMPQYGARCAENIKSGKVLLELSDLELECGLGITHPMHRKKIRLAIEEHRHPALVRYPCIAQLGHTWVSSEWLPDLGLSQYSENFASNMVDARMLEHLSKKELEKYLGVTRKFHQASIVHGIHLLRIMKYDRQALAVRRHQCENMDADPLVWTNQRFVRWARSIDLGEYADNLKDSGVHGGLVVLEPSFNGDTMATALGIPASKNIIRRHLTAELEALILPARSTLEHYVRVRAKSRVPGGSLGRPFSRSCGGLTAPPPVNRELPNMESRRASIRGSLSRALGLTKSSKSDREKQSPTSSSESSSVVSRVSPPLQYFSKSRSGGESPIYAQPFAHHHHHHPGSFHRRSEDYDGYACRSIDEYDITKSVQSVRSETDNISKGDRGCKLFGGSLPRGKKQHRRVRSIGDIDVIHVEGV